MKQLYSYEIWFSDLFHPDNIKNKHKDGIMSVSLHNYWMTWGGPKGIV
jgi:hypothetical protein